MSNLPIAIYQVEQIRELEKLANAYGVSNDTLMLRAGKAAFDCLTRRWPGAHRIAVVCGAGNNGGDGYVVARLARERGLEVHVWHVGALEKLQGDARVAADACKAAGVTIAPFSQKADLQTDVIVDALCGIGFKGELQPDLRVAITAINNANRPVIAIDVPSGLDANTGNVLEIAVKADLTVTFIGLKFGLLTGPGVGISGEIVVNDLRLPAELFAEVSPIAERIRPEPFAKYLQLRSRDWHKGRSGHVVIVGGDYGFSGAPRMAAEAALRVGAGLVSVATRPEHALTMNVARPEIMCHAMSDLPLLLEKADVVVVGPGLGQSEWAHAALERILETTKPLVVDADALNLLAKREETSRENWVLTPHPGEAARLLQMGAAEVQQDRLKVVTELQKKFGGTCMLKGAGTLVATRNASIGLCNAGNPGMATAGMGDVLSGVIASFIGQGVPLEIAAKLAVCLHAMAGDKAAEEGGERGLLAMDLLLPLRSLVNQFHS